MNAEKTQAKVKEVQALLAKLQLQIVPKQVVTKDGVIELGIFYADGEKYPPEPEVIADKAEEK